MLGVFRRHINCRFKVSLSTSVTMEGNKLAQLRKLMKERNLAAYYVPNEDAHQCEYSACWDERRTFMSGFSGSAGFAIVTTTAAALWTDGRYFLQAEQQLDQSQWTLMRTGIAGTPTKEEWVKEQLATGDIVGVDAKTVTHDAMISFGDSLRKNGLKLELCKTENLVDLVWGDDRPAVALQPITYLPIEFSGELAMDKLMKLSKYLTSGGYTAFVATSLDEIAWLFNLRGSDITNCPVFFSYALIQADLSRVVLYVDEQQRVTKEAVEALQTANVELKSYNTVFADLASFRTTLSSSSNTPTNTNTTKLLVSTSCNAALVDVLGSDLVDSKRSPVQVSKAIKNAVEQQGFRDCHIRDGVALVRYFSWLQEQLTNEKSGIADGGEKIVLDEVTVSEKLGILSYPAYVM